MKKSTIITTLIVLVHTLVIAQTQRTTVFRSGEDGYLSYRIPAIISLNNGELLAFCEGRKNGASDFGDNDIVMKRSTDRGRTWQKLQLVVDYTNLQASNSAPVLDTSDPKYPNGRIFLFYNTGNAHEYEVRSGKGLREAWYITSTDMGKSWSQPVNITKEVHRPNQPRYHTEYRFPEDWRAYANTPGHALQIKNGKYKGRIYVAANHSKGNPKNDYSDYQAHGYYTDDHGKSFKISKSVEFPGSNESTAAELSSGKLILNSRNQKGDAKARIVSTSNDGGETWAETKIDHQLPDPVNQGSLLNLGKRNGKEILAFCNAADTKQRNNLTLRISLDEGKSWTKSWKIDHSDDPKIDFTAYSDLVKIGENKIGILYERNNYQEIVFTTINWK